MITPGTLFYLWMIWTAIVTATSVVWWYESRVMVHVRRRNARLVRDLEACRYEHAGVRR